METRIWNFVNHHVCIRNISVLCSQVLLIDWTATGEVSGPAGLIVAIMLLAAGIISIVTMEMGVMVEISV